ncbi:MAG: hypothetical protein COT81_04830 [Candidatus Buchananbacteria bacterium CG10_big_fil_rev_8_21_14_0_10_42_9]|uniref:Uncharacterized protein n=1 Tax=Candidatus Buchananbacteria bacterium CG10_big_fil_rev_8_21_14_0_10_42_9 TaxID=1974526 RepID=A0A2H0W058_9BACT|nr:MAG: hypothetical protein COT81_04830 [Candidatus Buchananbacteria bacterium CG10_big_fil_rev_8_21_14_0_10_42_9]
MEKLGKRLAAEGAEHGSTRRVTIPNVDLVAAGPRPQEKGALLEEPRFCSSPVALSKVITPGDGNPMPYYGEMVIEEELWALLEPHAGKRVTIVNAITTCNGSWTMGADEKTKVRRCRRIKRHAERARQQLAAV